MKKHWRYAKYVIRHKWYVFLEACRMGIPLLGLIHDWSKLLPGEWFPYAEHFFGEKTHHGDGSHQPRGIKTGRDETGYYKPADTGDLAFDYALFLHLRRNKHHWQWWALPVNGEEIKAMRMPARYAREMWCDFRGAGRAQGTPDTGAWYAKNGKKMHLHSKTREWLEMMIQSVGEEMG